MECGIRMNQIRTAGRPATATMVAVAQQFIRKPAGFLSIHGGNGNGKTTVVMAIVNEIIANGTEAQYTTASAIAANLRETFKDGSKENDYDRLREMASIPVLVIDEFEKLRDTPYSREIQQELINQRYRHRDSLGTVVVWNGELDALPWPAVRSRITEGIVVHNSDSDLRPLLGDKK